MKINGIAKKKVLLLSLVLSAQMVFGSRAGNAMWAVCSTGNCLDETGGGSSTGGGTGNEGGTDTTGTGGATSSLLGGTTTVIANDITALEFEGDTAQPEIVSIRLEAQRATPGGRTVPETPMQISGQAEVRNS